MRVATKRQAALNKVFGKSVDFVICSAIACDPVAVIEVDDRSHLLPGRRARDEFVNRVFAEIGPAACTRAGPKSLFGSRGESALASAGIEGRLLRLPSPMKAGATQSQMPWPANQFDHCEDKTHSFI